MGSQVSNEFYIYLPIINNIELNFISKLLCRNKKNEALQKIRRFVNEIKKTFVSSLSDLMSYKVDAKIKSNKNTIKTLSIVHLLLIIYITNKMVLMGFFR